MRLTNRPDSSVGAAPGLLPACWWAGLNLRLLARELVGHADQHARIDAGRVADQPENQNRADPEAAGTAGKAATTAATAAAAAFAAAILDVLTFRKVFPAHDRDPCSGYTRRGINPSAVTNARSSI